MHIAPKDHFDTSSTHSVLSVSISLQAVRVWDVYPDNDSFCAIAIQRHTVKMVYLVSQVCHYSHMSMHKKNKLITVITATKRTTKHSTPRLSAAAVYGFLPYATVRMRDLLRFVAKHSNPEYTVAGFRRV